MKSFNNKGKDHKGLPTGPNHRKDRAHTGTCHTLTTAALHSGAIAVHRSACKCCLVVSIAECLVILIYDVYHK